MAGFKTDPLLARSEPVSDSGNTAGVTALRRRIRGVGNVEYPGAGEKRENM